MVIKCKCSHEYQDKNMVQVTGYNKTDKGSTTVMFIDVLFANLNIQ